MDGHSNKIETGQNPHSSSGTTAVPPDQQSDRMQAGLTRNLPGSPVIRSNLPPLLRIARSNGMFSSLSESDIDIVLSFCQFSFVEDDVRLFSAGDRADYLLFVADGRVDVTCTTTDHQVLRVGTVGVGAILGESSITSISPRAASVTTASRCALGYLHHQDFNRLCVAHPETALRFLIMLFDQMNGRMRAMVNQLTNTSRVRSAAELSMEVLSRVLFDRRVGAPRQAVDGMPQAERRGKKPSIAEEAQ